MAGKNITIRVSQEEFNYYKELSKYFKVNTTTLVKDALRNYAESAGDKSLKEEAVSVIKPTQVNHPLLNVIEKEGISVYDDEGNEIARITNLIELLNFVRSKVFQNEES